MILSNRESGKEFTRIIDQNRHKFKGGIFRWFTGSSEQFDEIMNLKLHFGINASHFKTSHSIEALKKIPLDKIVYETGSPFTDFKKFERKWGR